MCRACQKNVIINCARPVNRKDIKCTCKWREAQVRDEKEGGVTTQVWVAYPHPCMRCLRSFHRPHPTDENVVIDVYGNRYKMAVPPVVLREL